MALNPLSPGVYIEEIPRIPASIAGVATAIPAFIGYVEKAERNGEGIPMNTPVRIASMLEFETIFGGPDSQPFTIDVNDNTLVSPTERTITVTKGTESLYRLYYNMQMYFSNGGGPCYIVPVSFYTTKYEPAPAAGTVDKNLLLAGLAGVAKQDEPTLLLFPDAYSLALSDSKEVYDAALAQCELLKDRFTIMDVKQVTGNPVTDAGSFRNTGIGPDNLRYGASYYPDLRTTLNYIVNSALTHIDSYTVDNVVPPTANSAEAIDFMNLVNTGLVLARKSLNYTRVAMQTLSATDTGITLGLVTDTDSAIGATGSVGTLPAAFSTVSSTLSGIDSGESATALAAAGLFNSSQSVTDGNALILSLEALIQSLEGALQQVTDAMNDPTITFVAGSLGYLQNNQPSVYSSVTSDINSEQIQLNSSGAMAGIYARVDRERGVWQAPANVGVRSVLAPAINITTSQQDGLNIDATSGKSINAIRAFTGRGILPWGARTLAGNDNEWRYINVRRLFIFIEESIQEATDFVVFEPNTGNTWQRVRGMIESFLTAQWRDGALAGATTEEAFFVRVGLGTTMTSQDILEGRMIVEIGLAAVRPAEFIILKFEHLLQQS